MSLVVVFLLCHNDKTRRRLMSEAETYRRENQELQAELQRLLRREQSADCTPATAADVETAQKAEPVEQRTNEPGRGAEPAESSPAKLQEKGPASRMHKRRFRQETHSSFPSAPLSRGEHVKNDDRPGPADPAPGTPEQVNELLENLSETFGTETEFADAEPTNCDDSEKHVEGPSPTAFPLEPGEESSTGGSLD